jgi:hypothetical protein
MLSRPLHPNHRHHHPSLTDGVIMRNNQSRFIGIYYKSLLPQRPPHDNYFFRAELLNKSPKFIPITRGTLADKRGDMRLRNHKNLIRKREINAAI